MTQDNPWQLEPGERLLWQGRPQGGFAWPMPEMIAVGMFSILVALSGGGVTWLMATNDGPWLATLAASVALAGGIFMAYPLLDLWTRRNSHYAITTRRGLIRQVGKDLVSVTLDRPERLKLLPGPPDRIVFGHARSMNTGSFSGRRGAGTDICFDQLDDGAEAYGIMMRVAMGEFR